MWTDNFKKKLIELETHRHALLCKVETNETFGEQVIRFRFLRQLKKT